MKYRLKKYVEINNLRKLWLRELGIERLDHLIPGKFPGFLPKITSSETRKENSWHKKENSCESTFETGLHNLKKSVETCSSCLLHKSRKNSVFGYGPKDPKKIEWMLVGESPGEMEDQEGLPFVGKSGKLLDAMLNSIGLDRNLNVFITNIIKCRPPGNRNPTPEEINTCIFHLKRQIDFFSPGKILAVGKFAAQSILNTEATISSLRGKVHKITVQNDRSVYVIAMYHPAYLLRRPLEKAQAWRDLQIVASI